MTTYIAFAIFAILAVYAISSIYMSRMITAELQRVAYELTGQPKGAELLRINIEFDALSKKAMLPHHFNAVEEIREQLKIINRLNRVKHY